MRNLIFSFAFVALILGSCANTKPCPDNTVKVIKDTIIDTVIIKRIEDSLISRSKYIADSLIAENRALKSQIDSINVVIDTLSKRYLHSKLMIENARYYLRITINNSSQDKFLKGWMRRALEI